MKKVKHSQIYGVNNTEDFDAFHNNVTNDIAKYKDIKEIKGKPNQPQNFCPVSSLPWLTFTSVSQDTYGDTTLLFPLIRFGKYFEQNGKILVPLSISVNHAIADGYHSSKLLNEIQEWANDCEIWMKP